MADDKRGREAQSRDEDRRQRERAVATALARGDEPEPRVDEAQLDAVAADLESVAFPATGAEIVGTVGDREVTAADGTYAVAELVPDSDREEFESPAAVRVRVGRPTVASAMKRVVEAADEVQHVDLRGSQHDAYVKTFRALAAIDADDDDEGIRAIADWIVEQVRETGKLPGSRAVRRKAADFCRTNAYPVRDDEWLGI